MFVFADKPAGVTTHTSLNDNEKTRRLLDPADGFLEFIIQRRNEKLWPVHRLDKNTTGAIVFATSSESAERAREAFECRAIRKKYLFVTDQTHDLDSFERESFISKAGREFVSSSKETPNSKTTFRLVHSLKAYSLWEASPESGKSHQIRLHAQDAGIPILGDSEHGGSSFPTLCLHSASLEIPEDVSQTIKFTHESPAPRYFNDLSLINDQRLCRWLAAIDRRERLLKSGCLLTHSESDDTLRWIHSEGDPLRVDQLGRVFHLSWFSARMPNESEWASIRRLLDIMGWKEWYFQLRGDRGRTPNEELVEPSSSDLALRWEARERDLKFEFRRDSGLSPGLFLDQRANREMLQRECGSKSVLNLFCYTGGFSVAAAQGGANKVVSVDVSKTFLDWAKRNFELNGLSLENVEFRSMDAREYLAWAQKKSLKFDWVICDPPSFGRSKVGVFKIEKDLSDLIASLIGVAAPGGKILFSVNFESWSNDEFIEKVRTAVLKADSKAKLEAAPAPDWDFELPHFDRNMKAVLINRSAAAPVK